jgi:hypothetical protein
MPDNFAAKDSSTGTDRTFRSTDVAGVQIPHKIIDSILAGASPDIGAVTDAAIITNTDGSMIGFLRGIVVLLLRLPASIGQKLKAASLSVTLATDHDPLQLAAGSAPIGGVKDNGPFYVPTQTLGASPDALAAALDITTAPGNPAHAVILDDLLISAAVDMVITIKEAAGANLAIFHYKTAMGAFPFSPRNRLRASVNKKMQIASSAAGQVYTWASWHEE